MRLTRWTSISVFLIGLWVLLSNSSAHSQQVQSATGQSASNPSSSSYVGTDTCKTCHDDSRHGSSGRSASNLEGMDGLLKPLVEKLQC
jgi:cytochrome c553